MPAASAVVVIAVAVVVAAAAAAAADGPVTLPRALRMPCHRPLGGGREQVRNTPSQLLSVPDDCSDARPSMSLSTSI